MTTLTDIRTRVRQDLKDSDAANYRWSDSELNRHIQRALDETSRAIPLETSATLMTTPGSRSLSLASLSGLIAVEAVEYPVGQFPPEYAQFSAWATGITLLVDSAPASALPVSVFYTAQHTLDGSGTTLAGFQEDIVATGASAFAVLESSAAAIDRLSIGGGAVPEQFLAWARAREIAFRQLLIQHARRGRVRVSRVYAAG
ncbi:MAG: hypothetical protein ABIP13_00525 [Tepidiformaceae bacterium]